MKFLLLCLILIVDCSFASEGEVIRLKGRVYMKQAGKEPVRLSNNSKVSGDAFIITGKNSIVRIKFKDGSAISLGPESKMVVNQADPKKPKLIELLKGKIRGHVDKEFEQNPNYEHKMYIKTRSASMGVRGTDFVVVYNDKNHITSNITLKGDVELYKRKDEEIHESIRENFDEGKDKITFGQGHHLNNVDDDLKDFKTDSVKPGQFSGAFPSYEKPLPPVRISPAQYKALAKNEAMDSGRRGKVLKGDYEMSNYGDANDVLVPSPPGEDPLNDTSSYNSVNPQKGGVREGGLVDMDTGIYIAPPKGAKWDPVNKSYIMPEGLGGVDSQTGSYVPPRGIKLDPLNGFVPDSRNYGDRDWQKNMAKLKNLTGNFNEQLGQALDIFKEMTRLDLLGIANFGYIENVMEDYYGEFRYISNRPSSFWDLRAFGGFQLLHNKRWLVYPKASITAWFYNRKEPIIERNNTYTGMLGFEVHRKHWMYGKSARLILDSEFKTTYTDHRQRNLFDFYTEDTGLKITERFQFNRKHHTDLYYQIRSYHGFEDRVHGNIHNVGFKHSYLLSENYDLLLGFEHSERRDKLDGQAYKIENAYTKFVRKDLFTRTDVTFGYTYQTHHTRKITAATPFDKARYYKLDLLLNRRLGDFWKLNGIYEFSRQRAKGIPIGITETRSFIRQMWAMGLTMVF